jgi:phosphopantothenoylcysteine decarboxylase/phosphopantothenate--cysteine ligase
VLTSVNDEAGWNNHVELGLWADVMIVAPATANTLAKMANGICDNILTACYLSAKCPVMVAPAMDLDMWKHPSTQRNLETLRQDGVQLIPVGDGELASGLFGPGRLAEPEEIADFVNSFFTQNQILQGYHVLITSGPTHEPIDPVRFIGNRSTGKMGAALADALAARGAAVTMVSGPSIVKPVHQNIKIVSVETAEQMYHQVDAVFGDANIAIFAAAVADYTPDNPSEIKIKKSADEDFTLSLKQTVDIAKAMGLKKKPNQFTVGFALETHDELKHAQEKLAKKNLDLLVLNSLNDPGAGFAHDTNLVTLIDREGHQIKLDLQLKSGVAEHISNKICSMVLGD